MLLNTAVPKRVRLILKKDTRMIGIRQKIMLGFGGLLAIIAVVGTLTMVQLGQLGKAIDVILQENYRSVVACQDMKESLERIDSGILYTLSGKIAEGNRLIIKYDAGFRQALGVELGNITLPQELEKAQQIEAQFKQYMKIVSTVVTPAQPHQERQTAYFSEVQPLFQKIKTLTQDILLMNQRNMVEANDSAREKADVARKVMLAAIIAAAFLTLLFSYLAHRWILYPISRLIESTNEIRSGNLDLVVKGESSDEIGRLSESFNEMAAALRKVRKEDRVTLIRTKRATEEVFKALPATIAVFDLEGKVEISTETADQHFGLKPGVLADDLGFDWLLPLIRKALDEYEFAESDPKTIQQFIDNREYFFQPVAVPIPAGPERREPTGVALILKDVTQVREQQEMKRDVVSTVSHQLKTPLTSIRMSIHLLLEERIGQLNEKQIELLMAAREDSERLASILNDLLNINRIESGKSRLATEAITPRALVRDSVEPYLVDAKDKGVTVVNAVSEDLPEVVADPAKIRHVFANLLSNALRFTDPGGSVTISAEQKQDRVEFRLEDTGQGMPEEELEHLFERFYRAPGQDEKSGVGLGLAIVKEIIRAHGGDVGVESVIGKGSIFHLTLPLRMDKAENTSIETMEKS